MKKIKWTLEELAFILQNGEVCPAVAEEAMKRNCLNFDDVEQINNHYESHKWGSDADRRYRKRAINKAIAAVSKAPLLYTDPNQLQEASA